MAAKKKTARDFLIEAGKMSEDQQAELASMGVVLPIVDDNDAQTEFAYGYLCADCGQIAMEFIGTRFRQADGSIGGTPDPRLKMNRQPWTQTRRDPADIDKNRPTCQHCGCGISTTYGSPKAKLVVSLARYEADQRRRNEIRNKMRGQRETTGLGVPAGKIRDADPSASLQEGLSEVTVSEYDPTETPFEGQVNPEDSGLRAGDLTR